MPKVRVLRRENKAYVELPEEMLNYQELELFPLKKGYYLLSTPLGNEKQRAPGDPLDEEERHVLKKLLSIRFEKRTPPYVAKALSQQEKEVLRRLEKKNFVNVYRDKKYRQGVYNIRNKIYPLLRGERMQPKESKGPHSDSFSLLKTQGYIIIKDKREAFELSRRLNQEKRNSAIGVKGFDGSFYIVTRDYLTKAQAAIFSVLKEEMDPPSIAEATKLDSDGCMTVLRLMAENGDIIEKKKGVFAPV